MKTYNIYNNVGGALAISIALSLGMTSCDDQIMEWKSQGDSVTAAEIPLAVKEVLANYDDIKAYAEENHPNMTLGLGIGMNIYMGEDGRRELSRDNFQMITWGNAMKMDAIVKNNGSLNFANLDPALDALQEDGMKLYGHNFIWHTQQNQTYLKTLIAPTFETQSDSNIKNLLMNGDFENGNINPWFGWGNNSTREYSATDGVDGSACIVCTNPAAGNDYYVAQLMQDFDSPLENGKTYTMRFKARSAEPGGSIQLCMQNTNHGNGGWYKSVELTTSWATYEFEYTCSKDDNQELAINFGKVADVFYFDDVEFGEKQASPDAGRTNLLVDGSFDENASAWSTWNGGDCKSWNETEGNEKAGCMQVVNPEDQPGNEWKVQIHANFINPIPEGTKFYVSYYIKCAEGTGSVRCSTTGNAHYQGNTAVSTNWNRVEWVVTAGGEVSGINFDLGLMQGTYYIDDVVVSLEPFSGASGAKRYSPRRAKIIWTFKTPEEKAAVLTDAMEAWIKGMAEHLNEKGIVPVGYDVINEAIADGSNKPRGYDGVFGGSVNDGDGNVVYDKEPQEGEEYNGLNLNWGSGHFYWGYYVPDYAVKAFQFARQYLPAETKLFYNDYNLESSPGKLAAVVDFVNKIDEDNGSPIVDGIGSQMHITLSGTNDDADNNNAKVAQLREQVDAMFQTLAATGKLVRVTELDISLGTSSPSAAQYKAQSDAFRTVFESYFENVPEAQQSGITIWSLTDAEDEHEYWLKGQTPNLFDAKFKRKWAYKGVCDALAGEDLGLKYGGEDYKAYYEKQNVSETVK